MQRSRTAIYEPYTIYMSHEVCIWVTNYTYDSRIWCVSQELYIWVTNYKYESRMMYMSHELCMMYNSRKDVHEAFCNAAAVLLIRHALHIWVPNHIYMSAESYIRGTDYTYECRTISTWVTHHIYESRMMYTSHELSSIHMWVTD